MGASSDEPICVTIVRAIADAEDRCPSSVDFILHDHVNTDTLEKLSKDEREDWEFRFTVPDHEVSLNGDGTILVDGEKYPNE